MEDREQEDIRRRRRYDREHRARLEAEAIAERVTSQLYATGLELKEVNQKLEEANEVLEAANQSIREFVAVASHDMRGPLTSILGFTGMLLTKWDALKEEQRVDFLETIHRQGSHLERLVDDLLTISKIEAGAVDAHIQEVYLRRAIEEAVIQFSDQASEVSIEASYEIRVKADPDHLQRILVNYVENAFKYGLPPVRAAAAESNGWVEVRVCDVGRGVPEEFVPRLFDKFARAEDEVTRSQKGTGLGLSIVKGLARANGGDAWYEPNQPQGSVFAVRLPNASWSDSAEL